MEELLVRQVYDVIDVLTVLKLVDVLGPWDVLFLRCDGNPQIYVVFTVCVGLDQVTEERMEAGRGKFSLHAGSHERNAKNVNI